MVSPRNFKPHNKNTDEPEWQRVAYEGKVNTKPTLQNTCSYDFKIRVKLCWSSNHIL